MRSTSYILVTWLCLAWFGLAGTVLAGGVVVCRDGSGVLRLEWMCERNTHGGCLAACGDEADDDHDSPTPVPCDDTPVRGEVQITKAPARAELELAAPLPVAVVVDPWGERLSAFAVAVRVISEPERPPDPIRHIRTVVLLV
ncbi:MAG: hypothetical protein KF745_00935 [Phycisphaeraceae bacterium]|nr:hypothetical protein [Phycisphaeraceae bacterium]